MTPAVSVVMAVYNGERFLEQAVESVLGQSLSDIELVVVDDGSTDKTPKILADLAARDRRVAVHRQANSGRTEALNVGVGLAKAPLVARLDADDVCLPERLARQVEVFDQHKSVGLVGGGARLVDADGRPFEESMCPLSDEEIRRAFSYTTPFFHSAVMFRKDAFEAAGRYRRCFVESEDLDLWLRIAERHDLLNLAALVIEYRMHGEQASLRHLEQQALSLIAAHVSARARRERRPDPIDQVAAIEEDWLLAQGITRREITSAIVDSATWVAKAMGRAGYTDEAETLLADAEARARSDPHPGELLATVHRARATRHAEQGRPLQARLQRGRALLAERRR